MRRKCLAQFRLARPFFTLNNKEVTVGSDVVIWSEQRFPLAVAADQGRNRWAGCLKMAATGSLCSSLYCHFLYCRWRR